MNEDCVDRAGIVHLAGIVHPSGRDHPTGLNDRGESDRAGREMGIKYLCQL